MPRSPNVPPGSTRTGKVPLIALQYSDTPPPAAPEHGSPGGLFENPDYLEGSAIRADNAPLARKEMVVWGRLRRPARNERDSRAPSV